MDTLKPASAPISTQRLLANAELIPETQAELERVARQDAANVSRLSYGELKQLTEEQLELMPAYVVMWYRMINAATGPVPHLPAANFVQEHLVGKAIQKTETKNISITYSDLLKNIRLAEDRFQEARNGTKVMDTKVIDVQATESRPISWADVI